VLELRFVEGRGYTEIAQALGCSENAARVRCHRALTRLETHLAAHQQSLTDPRGTNR
jgi:DNA-directed RNA polymerase specialized sigma24 family protein